MVGIDFDTAVATAATRRDQAMLRRITDMPAGTIGFEAVGEVEDDDWEETVEPVLRQEIAAHVEGWRLGVRFVTTQVTRHSEGRV
jgi:hypothetical protein